MVTSRATVSDHRADAGQVGDDGDAERLQFGGWIAI